MTTACVKCGNSDDLIGPFYDQVFYDPIFRRIPEERLRWSCAGCGYNTYTKCLDSKEPE